jgi:hypothetical protein
VDARCCSLTVSEDDVRGKKEFVVLEKGKMGGKCTCCNVNAFDTNSRRHEAVRGYLHSVSRETSVGS